MLTTDMRFGRRRFTCRAAAGRKPWRGTVAGVAVAIWLAIFVTVPADAGDPGLERITHQFEDVAFGHEYGPTRNVIRKWTENPRLAFFAQREHVAPYLALIRRHIETIRDLTGLALVAAKPREATLRFGFSRREEFAKLPHRDAGMDFERFVSTSACIAIAIGDPHRDGRIMAGAIAIGIDIPESQRRHCILEELVQVLGLPNDACHYRPSLFCEHDRVFELTRSDAILLRTLYDDRLQVGMPQSEAMAIARTVIAELLGGETLPTGT